MATGWIQVDGLSSHAFLSHHSKDDAIGNEECGRASRETLWRNGQRTSRRGDRSRGGGVRDVNRRGESEGVPLGRSPRDNESVHSGDDGTEVGPSY
jgi:hypothetical protein